MQDSPYQAVAQYVRTYLLRSAQIGDPKRGEQRATARYWHTLNVYRTVGTILDGEGADERTRKICSLGALFHDVDVYSVSHSDHGIRGAETATRFLRKNGYPQDVIELVAHAVRDHNYDFDDERSIAAQVNEMRRTMPPTSLMVLDADVLDKIGVSNILTAVIQVGRADKSAREATLELTDGWPIERARVWRDFLTTTTGQQLGDQRFAFYEQFIAQIDTEIVMHDPFEATAIALARV